LVDRQEKPMKSLQIRLSVVVSIVATALGLLAGFLSFVAAFENARELQDRRLSAIANLFEDYDIPIPRELRNGPEASFAGYIAVEAVGGSRKSVLNLPDDVPEGYRTLRIDGEDWRVFVRMRPGSRQRLAVGQRTVIRNDIARSAGLWTAVPLLMLVPILCGVIFLLVRRMLKPIAAFSIGLYRRTESDLSPLQAEGLPSEFGSIVPAINSVLRRLDHSMELQRRFIADAAHELRSPFTTLSIQVDNVRKLVSDAETVSRCEKLRFGIARAHSLIEKLLALARAQTLAAETPVLCHVEAVLRSVLEGLLPAAESRNVEIDVSCPESLSMMIGELELTLIVRNLLDNAIRYSKPGGSVNVAVWKSEQGGHIEVTDHGPGIPVFERERVFDPFYRILGSDEVGNGLGLSIVKTIVQRLGGSIELSWSDEIQQEGLRVLVSLPIQVEQ
jgi:two-component system, OmpR family, sensor kinase